MTTTETTAPAQQTRAWLPVAAVLCTMVFWASAFVAIRHLGGSFDPGPLSLGRMLTGAVVLSLIMLVSGHWVRPTGQEWLRLLVIGLLWYAVYHVALNAGELRVDAGTASMLLQASPVLIALAAAVFLDEPFTRELGLGLGLSIVRSIVDLLEGHALAMHSRLGLGTRFYVDLPRTEGLQGIARTVIEEMPALDVAGTYVLYVEDDSLVRTSTEALLAEFGVLCDVSRSYEELSGKLSRLERMPDIILTDFRLSSEHTAIDVIAAVRAEFDARIPVILLTGESEGFSPPQELGEVVILRKPVSASALLAQVQRIVSASKAGQR